MVDRKLPDDLRDVCDFIDGDPFAEEVRIPLLNFWNGLNPKR